MFLALIGNSHRYVILGVDWQEKLLYHGRQRRPCLNTGVRGLGLSRILEFLDSKTNQALK